MLLFETSRIRSFPQPPQSIPARVGFGGMTARSAPIVLLLSALFVALPSQVLGQNGTPKTGSELNATWLAARNIDAAKVRDTVAAILARAVRDSAFPGAVAVVGTRDGAVARVAVGALDYAAGSATPDENTLWDLASLTKVVALTTAMMQLSKSGKVNLNAPVGRYLPRFTGKGKQLVRVRDLLTHTSGLPAWRPLYKEASSREEALALVYNTPLEAAPRSRMVYSDLGAILLGQIVERQSGLPFDRYVERYIAKPLGMESTQFLPPVGWRERTAPTEIDPWRQRHLQGEVHDENAAILGGVSSHAGLFSNATDLIRFSRMLLNHGILDGVRIVDSTILDRFTKTQDPTLSTRGLGWEMANGTNSGGTKLSKRAFGHTGFTGTSLWIDPGQDLFVLLLTNRVNPTRENRRIGGVRVALADAVVSAMKGGKSADTRE